MNLSNNEGSITPLSNDSENTDIEEDNNDEITGNYLKKLIISENQKLTPTCFFCVLKEMHDLDAILCFMQLKQH
jgi:hypothetical protein